MNKYKEAEIIFQNTLSIIKRKFKEKTLAYATAMNNLANVYNEMGNYTKAEENYLEVLEIREKFLGKNHLDYAFTLNALGLFYASTNRYTLSKELLLNALSVREKKLGKTSGAYAVTLNNLGLLYSNMGNYEAAELNYTEAFTIIKKVFGTNHNLYITALNNLGFLYKDIGKFEASEKYLLEALSILKNKSGEESNDYGLCQNNLGLLYLQTGNYTKAEKLFINASEIFKKNYGEQNVKYALMLNNLSVFYLKMGNFSKAETTLLAAINIYENNDIESSLSDYALAANNLGFVWEQYELFTEAEKMYTSAAKIYKAVAGAENPFYATCISNLARFYASRKQKQKAEELFKEVLNIRKKTLPLNHPDYALALNNLGAVYLDNGKTDSAEWVIQEAANIFKTNFGITHPEYTTSLYNLCYLYYINNRFANWQNIIDSIADVESKTKKTLLNSFTENEKEIYLTQKNYFHSVFQSMLFHFKSDKTKNLYQNIAANQEWLLKGKQLLNNLAATSNNQDVIALFNDWQKASVMYAKAIQLSQDVKEKNGLNEDSLLQKTELLEKKLIEALPSVQQTLKNNNIYFSAITKKLNTDDVVIHWTFYNYCNKNLWTDSIIYAAYISKSTDTAPKLITVFEEKQLQALLKKYHGGTGRSSIKRDATTSETVDQDLYNLIWKPLLPYIKDAKKIYNLPSGLLHKVSFNALSDSNNHQLMDYQEIHQLLSIDELLNPIPVTQKNKTIALFGGANYETSNATTTTEGSGTPVFRGTEKLPPSNTSFNYLAGTEKEVIAVANSADKVFWKVHSFTGTNANEENLKKLNGHNAPQILHIATHGFYFPHKSNPAELVNYKTTNDIEAKDFPLLRSGIVLSGANNYWNKDTLLYNKEDGIVTAQEISNINFFNTDLVVLSACETALGDITGTEGVYGLQRAFKMAGVKKILMSLWEVPDEETSELMQLFYTNIFNGDSYYIAFQKAQLRLKAKYKNPSKWAGFVLVGE
jgi:CHAT domain-containing protein/tetratricopeptide (TPR) repeat protein